MSESQPNKSIFRQQALEQLSSPEQLDELLRVTTRRSWLPIGTVGAALLLALIWSLVGQIPVTVEGSGILVYPRRVVSLQAPASGQIVNLEIKVGDFVDRGQLLGRLNQPELAQRLEQERVRLAEASRQSDQSEALRNRRIDLELEGLARKRKVLEDQITTLADYAESQRKRNQVYLRQQTANLDRVRRMTREIGRALEDRYASYQRLLAEGLSSEDTVLGARERMVDSQMKAAELELRAQEIEMDRLRAESDYQELLNRIAGLETQVQEIAIREAELAQQRVEAETDRELRIQEIQRNIERYEEELRSKGRILSEFRGQVLELNVAAGQIVGAGERLGAIEAEDTAAKLVAAGYFAVGDGKRLELGDRVRISPATVESARYGNMLGEIVSVSSFPVSTDAIANVVGNREVAAEFARGGSRIEVMAELEPDPDAPSGFRWSSGRGPEIEVSAGTTASLRATVEQRRPISFVIPILRSWSGL